MTCLNAPKLLAIVGTLTKAASIHLFSLFAALKMVFSIGAILISTLEISSGSSLQSKNFLYNIYNLYFYYL